MRVCRLLIVLAGAVGLSGSVLAQPSMPSASVERVSPGASPAVLPSTAMAVTWPRAGGPRLRPVDRRLAGIIAVATERSAIVRALVDRLERSDAIVYLELNRSLGREGLAGCLSFAGQAGGFRYLRASLNADLPVDLMIAALAHELQHAVEVIDDTTVRSESTLLALYRRIGRQTRAGTREGWETDAALRVGRDVRRELAGGRTTLLAQVEARAGQRP